MRLADHLYLAGKTVRPGFGAACALLTALGTACLCFAGTIGAEVRAEKAAPCELAVTAPSYLAVTEQTVQDILDIPGVLDASGVLALSGTAAAGKYTAGLSVTGIDGEYLRLEYELGGGFPAGSAMPWLVLSREAAKSFADPEDKTRRTGDDLADIDWLEEEFTLTLGESDIPARVSGIFQGDEPVCYMSQDMAKQLLQRQGQPSGYTGAVVRIDGAGAAQAVTKAIADMGYQAQGDEAARQEGWDARGREAAYILAMALGSSGCAAMTGWAARAVHGEEDREQDTALVRMGLPPAAAARLRRTGRAYPVLGGIALGVLAWALIRAWQ